MPQARRRLNPMGAAVLANIALGAGKYYVRKYGAKTALAAGTAYAGYKGIKYATKTKPKVTRVKPLGVVKPKTKTTVQPIRKKIVRKRIVRKKISSSNKKSPMTGRRIKLIKSKADAGRTEVKVSQGKKLTTSQLVDRTVKASMQRSVFGWRQYSVESTGAEFNISLDQAGVGGSIRWLPLYLFDLTARPQNTGGTVKDAIFASRAYSSTAGVDDGKIKWASVAGLTPNAAPSNFVQVLEAPNLGGGQSQAHSILSWFDIKAHVQGPRSIPSKVTFQIIKLLDDELDPTPFGSYTQDGTNSVTHQVFWQSQIAPLTVSPIHDYVYPKKKYIKVIATKTFEFNPKETIDKDTRGQMYVLKWFNRINKLINYANVGNSTTDDATFNSRTIITNPAGQTVSPYADSKDKIFLLVKGYAPIASAAFNSEIHSSFELNCKMCHTTMI